LAAAADPALASRAAKANDSQRQLCHQKMRIEFADKVLGMAKRSGRTWKSRRPNNMKASLES
jgi:hypothetical protein